MTVVSGVTPYQYIDIPFVFLGRFGGPSVSWSNEVQLIPEISGFLYEQAMYVHLAEIRKYGIEDPQTKFYNYRAAIVGSVAKEEITNPDPSGAQVSPSGNPYCLNYIEDLRDSMDLIFSSVAWDTDVTTDFARQDYLRTSFSPLPSGANGDFQYRLPEKVLSFGSIFGANEVSASGVIGASGYLDTQTIREISYQPYARLSRRGEHTYRDVTYETAPLFPALVKANGSAYAQSAYEDTLDPGNYTELDVPQTSGYNPGVIESGLIRVCGDGFTPTTQLRIISESNTPLINNHISERWFGELVYRNASDISGIYSPGSSGMAMMDFISQSPELQHGVHRIIVSDINAGYGPSGQLSAYPGSDYYEPRGWLSGIIAAVDTGAYAIIRNEVGGIPTAGTSLSGMSYTPTPVRSRGIHVCDELFGGRNSSGLLNLSPFNNAALLLNAVERRNFGGDGSITAAYFTTQPPPGITYVWRRSYDTPSIFWRDISTLIQPEGESTAYGFHSDQWAFRSYSSQQLPPPPDPATSAGATAGLGQSTEYHFLEVDLTTRGVERKQVNFSHIGNHGSYGMGGIAWSRNYGWFGVGGRSIDSHMFESFTITSIDGGSFIPSSAGAVGLSQPIGIGNKSFARRTIDIAGGFVIYWELTLGVAPGYNTILANAYSISVDSSSMPFDANDFNNFVGHTIFIGANDEGITSGDWVVVGLTDGRRFLCRAEIDSGNKEIDLVECLFEIQQASATPEVFMNV